MIFPHSKRTAVAFLALLLAATLNGQTTLYEFEAPAEPSSSLVDGGDGYYYSTTKLGGNAGKGTIFKVDLLTGQRTTIVTFNGTNGSTPYGDVVFDGSFLYGTTYYGGANNMGTVYKVDRSSGKLTTIASFSGPNGAYPRAGVVFFGSDLYGTTTAGGPYVATTGSGGTIFKVDPSTGALTSVAGFRGASPSVTTAVPSSPLLVVGRYLYGATAYSSSGFGRLFKFDPATGELKMLSFTSGDPYAGLIAVGSYLYGTTTFGCSNLAGCIIRIDPANDSMFPIVSLRRLEDGADPAGNLVSDGRYLYGTAEKGGPDGWGTVFRVDTLDYTATTALAKFTLANGAAPRGALVLKDGALFGTTSSGGSNNGGTLFKLDLITRQLETISSFNETSLGTTPSSPLTIDGQFLYGTTSTGGDRGLGTLYRTNLSNDQVERVGSFTVDTGGNPTGGVVRLGGMLYGTTWSNGKNKVGKITEGTIYRANPTTGEISLLAAFDPSTGDGALPVGLTTVSPWLYGANAAGGAGGSTNGTLFRFDPVSGEFSTLFRFHGEFPHGRLLPWGADLYGTTYGGGWVGLGTVFRLNPSNGAVIALASILEGGHSMSALTPCGSLLYGTTEGTVYKFDPENGVLTTIATLADTSGQYSLVRSDLACDSSVVYGTTMRGGADGHGSVFRIDTATGRLTTLVSFDGSNGDAPIGGLLVHDGFVYGTTQLGGSKGGGTLFRIAIPKPRRRSASRD